MLPIVISLIVLVKLMVSDGCPSLLFNELTDGLKVSHAEVRRASIEMLLADCEDDVATLTQ